ncbi:hypothetical protein D047_2836A, partial [Vibrio parahaemolyticus VPTS-2010_2]
MPFKP